MVNAQRTSNNPFQLLICTIWTKKIVVKNVSNNVRFEIDVPVW